MWKIDGFFDAFNSLHEIIEFLSHQSERTIWLFSESTISFNGHALFWVIVFFHDGSVRWTYRLVPYRF